MNNIEFITETLKRENIKVDYIVQHSYNPLKNNSIPFYIYVNNKLSHIVSTYRNSSIEKFKSQNTIMNNTFAILKSNIVKNNILFSTWIIENQNIGFRIQKFVEKRKTNMKIISDFEEQIKLSSKWIVSFQNETKSSKEKLPEVIKMEIENDLTSIKKKYSEVSNLKKVANHIIHKLDFIKTSMQTSSYHGDYFSGNYFIDKNNNFKVIDWEFSKTNEYVILDFYFNIITSWISLNKMNLVTNFSNILKNPSNKYENILYEELEKFNSIHGFSEEEINIYIVFVFIKMHFREEREYTNTFLVCYLNKINNESNK